MDGTDDQQPSKRRKVLLRLDDGSLIGQAASLFGNNSTAPALVDYEQACRLGKASEKDLERLQRIISIYEQRNAFDPLLKANALRPYNPYTQDGLRALRRQKPVQNGDVQQPQAQPPGDSTAGLPADFAARCMEVLKKTYATSPPKLILFNQTVKDIFYKPVSESFPTIADAYYKVITQPMTFREIERRLQQRTYTQPSQFAADVRLLFNNCRKFNSDPTNVVRKEGEKWSNAFEQAWAASGLCTEARTKRTTAGMAAAKFEPDDELPSNSQQQQQQPPQQQPARSRSHQGLPRNGQHPRGGFEDEAVGGQPSGAAAPTYSHEVNQAGEDGGVDQELGEYSRESLWQELINAIQDLEDPMTALDMLDKGVVTASDEGEVELDPDLVTVPSLIKVDSYLRSLKGLPPRFPVAVPKQAAAPAPAKQQAAAAPAAAAAAAASGGAAQAPNPAAAPATSNRSRGRPVVLESDDDYEEESDSDEE